MWENLSPREYHSMTGKLTDQHIEELLDEVEDIPDLDAIANYANEAAGQFPEEDCLQSAIDMANDLALELKGDKRRHIQALIDKLDALQTELSNASEYGRNELNKVTDIISEWDDRT